FANVRRFFTSSSREKKEADLDTYFLEVVDSVFKGKSIDLAFLMKFFMAEIRHEFHQIRDDQTFFQKFFERVKDALKSTFFVLTLGIISFKEVKTMSPTIFESLFDKYPILSQPEKRGTFLLGALTQLLLNKQKEERDAAPFRNRLKSLKMDEQDIKALLPKVVNKLEEYDSFDRGKQLIAEEASRYLLQSGDNWKMPVDEMNFYFCAGMCLKDEIASIVDGNKKEKEE
ncbi:MAG: type I-B CRISPR-associated protein Cas8b/Csh1, partial [bacterium]